MSFRASGGGAETILEFLPDAAILVDREGRIVYASAQAEVLFGYARGELLQQPVEVLMPERFRQRHAEHRRQYVLQPAKRAMGQRGVALWGRRKDGSEFPADIAIGVFEMAGGGSPVIAIIRDMTERTQAETALKREKDELQKINQIMLGLEERVVELKHEVNALLKELGRAAKYQA